MRALVTWPYGAPALARAIPRFWMDRSLKFAVLPEQDPRRSSRELIGGGAPSTATCTEGNGPFGAFLKSDGSAVWNIWSAYAGAPASITDYTLVTIIQPVSGSGRRVCLTLGGGGNVDSEGLLYQFTNNAFGFESNSADYGANNSAAAGGKYYVVVLTKNGANKKLYQDGVQLVSVTTGNNPWTRGTFGIGVNTAFTSDAPGNVRVSLVMLFDRLFSATEVGDISRALRPVSDLDRWAPMYHVPAAGGGTAFPDHYYRMMRAAS